MLKCYILAVLVRRRFGSYDPVDISCAVYADYGKSIAADRIAGECRHLADEGWLHENDKGRYAARVKTV